jgi:hypothetical protein
MAAERLDAFFIREVEKGDGTKESYWNRIGSAWVNRDGSINVKLYLTPPDGKIHLRKPKVRTPSDSQQVTEPETGPSVDFGEHS